MPAPSLLYESTPHFADLTDDALFTDLNIDQILASIVEGYEWADLPALYRQRPTRRADVALRQGIARDLQDERIRGAFEAFAQSLQRAAQCRASAGIAAPECVQRKWMLDACRARCDAIANLLRAARGLPLSAHGLQRLLAWLGEYESSAAFRALRDASAACARGFDAIAYRLTVDMTHNLATLAPDDDDADLCADIARTFPQFDLSSADNDGVPFSDIRPCALEEMLLERLERMHPAAFADLRAFCVQYPDAGDAANALDALERELAFYLSYCRHIDDMRARGFDHALPERADDGIIDIEGGYDASLARLRQHVVRNDFHAGAEERGFVLTGPNQAGKTTFARTLGQAIYFASLGLPVACTRARMGFFDGLYTHFAVEEDLASDSGRLQEELRRLRPLLDRARGAFVILNELFASTTTLDARRMGEQTLRTLAQNGCTCLYVTHLYELADAELPGGARVVSLVAGTPGAREASFVVARGPARGQGLSHRLLEKHGLSRIRIEERYHAAIAAIR